MTMAPLIPAVPALLVLNKSDPLLDDEPIPESIETRPPVAVDDNPADMTTSPPVPQFPEPTVK